MVWERGYKTRPASILSILIFFGTKYFNTTFYGSRVTLHYVVASTNNLELG